jgi:hypothetical protein
VASTTLPGHCFVSAVRASPHIEIPATPDALQDSDLNGVVDIRYTGGARMLLLIELGRRKSKMRIKV